MAPKRNSSLKFRALRKVFSVLFQMLGIRKGTKLLFPKKLQNIDCEATNRSKPHFEKAAVHGAGNDEDETQPLTGRETDEPEEDELEETKFQVLQTAQTPLADLLEKKVREKVHDNTCRIGGNIYRGMAFGLYKRTDCQAIVVQLGAFIIFMIQLLAPIVLLGLQYITIDRSTLGQHTTCDDFYLVDTQIAVQRITRALAGAFFLAICIWAYVSIGSEFGDWSKVYFAWSASADHANASCPFYQLLGAFMNQYVIVMNLIITGLMFVTTDNPVDIVMNALALQFLVSLDDFGGGFDFIPELWDPDMVGQVFYEQARQFAAGKDEKFQMQLWEKLDYPVADVCPHHMPSKDGVLQLFDLYIEAANADETTMELAFEKGGPAEYTSYYVVWLGTILSRLLVVVMFFLYVFLSNRGIQKYPSALERHVDVLDKAIANCTHEVCQVLQTQMQIAASQAR